VTIARTTDRLEVVDGQQRFATITVLLAAIRDYFLEHGDENGLPMWSETTFCDVIFGVRMLNQSEAKRAAQVAGIR
jgi:hypothetical protein